MNRAKLSRSEGNLEQKVKVKKKKIGLPGKIVLFILVFWHDELQFCFFIDINATSIEEEKQNKEKKVLAGIE